MKPDQFLTEAAGPGVGRPYQHFEDIIITGIPNRGIPPGAKAGLEAIRILRDMASSSGKTEKKWDGMPVVYWGRDEQGNFMMIPKNAWKYLNSGKTQTKSGAPTITKSPQDVVKFIMGTGEDVDPKERMKFAKQFANLWPYFEKISPKQGFLEGGLLFYPGTKPDGTTAMPVLNKETNKYDFQPNITQFHIPANSDLGKRIAKAKVGVAATGYYPKLGSKIEGRFPNAENLSTPDVFVQGSEYVQEPVTINTNMLDNVEKFIQTHAQEIDNYLAPKAGLKNPSAEIYSYLNDHLRRPGLTKDFPDWATANLSAKKAETMLSDKKGMIATLGAIEALSKQKTNLYNLLGRVQHGGIQQTKPEGYVYQDPESGQFVKIVNQPTWSPKESIMNEAEGKHSAVLGWGRGMGHTGHDALVTAVTHQAKQTGATPFFIVSRSFGKDDPIPPEMKLGMYKKKFPEYANMFSLPTPDATTINDVLRKLVAKGYTDVTLVVGKDQKNAQKNAFDFLIKPDKSGIPPYKQFGLNSLQVLNRQETGAPGSDPSKEDYHEGPRATPMRLVLIDLNKFKQDYPELMTKFKELPDSKLPFAVWRDAMSPSLSDQEVLQMMNTAKENLLKFNTPKPKVKKASELQKAKKLKEFIERIKPLLKEATEQEKEKWYNFIKEAKSKIIAHTVKDIMNPPKVMQQRAMRDQQRKQEYLNNLKYPKPISEDYIEEK